MILFQVTRIERPKERDSNKEIDRPVKDEIEVVHLKDGSRSSGRRAFQHSLSAHSDSYKVGHTAAIISLDKITTTDLSARINGYSNGYGSASEMEVGNEDLIEDSSDEMDYDNLEDLPPLPSPPQKVNLCSSLYCCLKTKLQLFFFFIIFAPYRR